MCVAMNLFEKKEWNSFSIERWKKKLASYGWYLVIQNTDYMIDFYCDTLAHIFTVTHTKQSTFTIKFWLIFRFSLMNNWFRLLLSLVLLYILIVFVLTSYFLYIVSIFVFWFINYSCNSYIFRNLLPNITHTCILIQYRADDKLFDSFSSLFSFSHKINTMLIFEAIHLCTSAIYLFAVVFTL